MQALNTYLLTCSLAILFSQTALGAANRMQVCVSKCKSSFCKKMAEDVEFEFEMSKDFLIPPCKASAALAKKEMRLVFTGKEEQVQVDLKCQGGLTCMSQIYDETIKGAALVAKVVSDVKAAVKHNKPFAPEVVAKASATKSEPMPAVKDEEWDRIVVPLIKEVKKPVSSLEARQEELPKAEAKSLANKSATLSFGGENWDYTFDADQSAIKVGAVHSRVYPRIVASASYWPISFMRISGNLSASIASLRIRANQPVEGDGQIVASQMFQGSLVCGFFWDVIEFIKIGGDAGYDFQGVFVDRQRLMEHDVTIVPGYQAHGIRLGPRLVLGATSDIGLIDIGAMFYPYTYYKETPDEPTSNKSLFAWGMQGLFRLMLSADLFLEGTLRTQIYQVRYTESSVRETADGEKWGSGKVTNVSTSATAGVGWLF